MNDYKITVVVPTYNTGDGLYNLFDSIMNQSMGFENVEVIFVDDASTDENTIAILEKLNAFGNVSVIFLENNSGFPGKGRNIGLEKVHGEYFQIMTIHTILTHLRRCMGKYLQKMEIYYLRTTLRFIQTGKKRKKHFSMEKTLK